MRCGNRVIVALLILSFAVGLTARAGEGGERTLMVAAAQTPNLDGQYERSREVAENMVAQAADQGARLILLPEFALIGYVYEDGTWEMAEPVQGPTVEWMRGLCRRYDVYLATCILEVRGSDFYDTLVLTGPGDGELWTHSKIEPALYEANFFKGAGVNQSVFDTPLGRIGVSICFDNTKTHTIRALLEERPDIVLMTYSAPEVPLLDSIRQKNIEANNRLPALYARILGVPVVSVNKTGRWDSPMPGVPGARLRSDFAARSRIVDQQGNLLASLDKEEAVITAAVRIGGDIKTDPSLIPPGRWLVPYDAVMRSFSDLTYKLGKIRYTLSPARKRAVEKARK
ncbi:MAG TPA: carbon-nitrogen hydrolase family protein [bacterium]|nr:carbon-nitrogen hydrolase family protein [bacterium]